MCFRKSPYKVYWAAKTMEDLFIPPDNTDDKKCSFFEKLSDTYVSDPVYTIEKLVSCTDVTFKDAEGNMKPPFLIENSKGEYYFILEKKTKKVDCHTITQNCSLKNPIYSNNPKDLGSNYKSAETNGFNFKVHHNFTL